MGTSSLHTARTAVRTIARAAGRMTARTSTRTSARAEPPPRRPIPLVAAAVTLLALAAAGCDSGGTSDSAATSPAVTSAAGTAPTSVSPSPSASASVAAPSTTAASDSATPQASSGAARCTVVELKLRLGRGDPGAGNIYFPLEFTNTADHSCTLDGFPGVSLLRGDGGVIGKPADREGAQGVAVRLAPGQTVQADLHTLNRGIKGDSCWRAPSLIMVYPPGSTDAMTLATTTPVVCGDTFDVSTVR